jgi:hypothetical protein
MKRQYVTPVIVKGVSVKCEIHGLVKIAGLTNAPIPWPISEHGLIVYKGLATAIRTEAQEDVAQWWGVPLATVETWKPTLGPAKSKSERKAKQCQKRCERQWTPEQDSIIRKYRPSESSRLLKLSYKVVAARRKKLGYPHARSGPRTNGTPLVTQCPSLAWNLDEDDLVMTLPALEVMLRTGRTLKEVEQRKLTLRRRSD